MGKARWAVEPVSAPTPHLTPVVSAASGSANHAEFIPLASTGRRYVSARSNTDRPEALEFTTTRQGYGRLRSSIVPQKDLDCHSSPRGVSTHPTKGNRRPGSSVQGDSAPQPELVCPNPRRFLASGPLHLAPANSSGRSPRLHSPLGVLAPSGSKRSTGVAAVRSAFRFRPISARSP
jgi:hypothetical protein